MLGSVVARLRIVPPLPGAMIRTLQGGIPGQINIDNAVDKAYEDKTFKEIAAAPISSLQGLADWTDDVASVLKIQTVRDLGTWKYYKWAEAIVVLAEKEGDGNHREEISGMNLNKALDKAHETKSLREIIDLPPSAFQGIAEHSDADLAKLHVKSIGALGKWKFARWASAITACAHLENEDVSDHR